MTENSNTINY